MDDSEVQSFRCRAVPGSRSRSTSLSASAASSRAGNRRRDERRAAWELYVELSTRIATVPPEAGTGLQREALTSLYTLFGTTREILRRYGPGVAQPKGDGSASFGTLAVTVLNDALRPLLSVWHPLLQDREDQRPPEVTRVEWERSWDRIDELVDALAQVRQTVNQYGQLLAEVAEVPALANWDAV